MESECSDVTKFPKGDYVEMTTVTVKVANWFAIRNSSCSKELKSKKGVKTKKKVLKRLNFLPDSDKVSQI